MTSLTTSRVRSCNISDKWPTRTMNNQRKTSIHAPTGLHAHWSGDAHPSPVQYTASNIYEDYNSEREDKFPEAKTSNETLIDHDEANVNNNDLHNCTEELGHANAAPKRKEETVLRRKNQQMKDYPAIDVPEAMMAMQKLQKLKELQRRRDLTEKYYTQEIRRLIGGRYFAPRMTVPSWRVDERMHSLQSYSGDRLKSGLEPCGTMTTITRLDCGCIQETRRPIFTTAMGRVLKKTCSQSKDEMSLRLTSSNPQEHLYSLTELQKEKCCNAKPKKKFTLDPRTYTKLIPNRNQEVTSNQRNEAQQSETVERTSRNVSPLRKLSDTSTTSV